MVSQRAHYSASPLAQTHVKLRVWLPQLAGTVGMLLGAGTPTVFELVCMLLVLKDAGGGRKQIGLISETAKGLPPSRFSRSKVGPKGPLVLIPGELSSRLRIKRLDVMVSDLGTVLFSGAPGVCQKNRSSPCRFRCLSVSVFKLLRKR